MAELDAASDLAPNQPRRAYVYALALHDTVKAAEAFRMLERALQHRPAIASRAVATLLELMPGDPDPTIWPTGEALSKVALQIWPAPVQGVRNAVEDCMRRIHRKNRSHQRLRG